ncbi:MAG: pantoate--beta-alanine ligase [Actinobacteria bacterium]|nr:pantoate--beta-alanine ligase [Actinomycetota bacterium]
MKVIKNKSECRKIVETLKSGGNTVGLVPTMGSLHEGHIALIRMARKECSRIFISIFVNPSQFGPGEDYVKYPRETKKDLGLAESEGVDFVFLPPVSGMYGNNHRTFVEVEGLGKIMCGVSRPTHFRGVATVVLKLFNIIPAHRAYFGEKDYQQLVIIKKMVKDLDIDIKITSSPTIRESDGLAMSSRNRYLTQEQRKEAVIIYKTLKWARREIKSGEKDLKKLRAVAELKILENRNIGTVEYFDFRDAYTLEEVSFPPVHRKMLIAAAVRAGTTRLIDNIVINVKK